MSAPSEVSATSDVEVMASAALRDAANGAFAAQPGSSELELAGCPPALLSPVDGIGAAIGMPLVFSRGFVNQNASVAVTCVFNQGEDSDDGRDWQLEVRAIDQADPQAAASDAGWLQDSDGWKSAAGGSYVVKTRLVPDQEPLEGGCSLFWYSGTLTVLFSLLEPSETSCADLEGVFLGLIPQVVDDLATLELVVAG